MNLKLLLISFINILIIRNLEAQNADESNKPKNFKEIFTVVEQNPIFKDGDIFLKKYIEEKQLEYIAQEDISESGTVILQFVVNSDSTVSDIKVARGINQKYDEIAVKIVESMPKWNPGKQRGRNVNVRYTLPVKFKKYVDGNVENNLSYHNFNRLNSVAEFNGGKEALKSYINFTKNMDNIKEKVYDKKIIPYAKLNFLVLEDGSLDDIIALNGTNEDYKKEAIRIVKTMSMSNWNPAVKNGIKFAELVELVIEFPND